MQTEIAKKNDFIVISLEGEFDLNDTEHFDLVMSDALKQSKKIIINCTELEYIDSSGIGQIIHLQTILSAEDGGELYLYGLTEFIFRVLSIANLDTFFSIKTEKEIEEMLS